MRTNTSFRITVLRIAVLGFLWLTSTGLADPKREEVELAVVVHPDTPVSNVNVSELRKIFRGERQYWSKDMPVVLLVRAPVSRERDAVVKSICQMTETQFKQYWIARIFRAEAVSSPIVVNTPQAANDIVATVPGAITVLEMRNVRPGLKVLRVNNLLPAESGYPISGAQP
jgi:phosphate transport system substrate-binding protein